jgi:transposase
MKLHANAALSLRQRERMVRRVVEEGWSITKAALAAEVSEQTCSKWVRRYRQDGAAGLVDRSSAPACVANRTDEQTIQVIAALRRLRFTGPEIAELLDRPLSTISGILTRIGMGRLGRLGLEPANRYERQRPGELIHIDVKKLGRIARPGHRVLAASRHAAARAITARPTTLAGNSCTSQSTTRRAWPTPKSCPTSGRPPRSPFSIERSRSSRATA